MGRKIEIYGMCEFPVEACLDEKYIEIGCEIRSFDFWEDYIDRNSLAFLDDCSSYIDHAKCLIVIQSILDIAKQNIDSSKQFYLYKEFSDLFEASLADKTTVNLRENDPVQFHVKLLEWAESKGYKIASNLLGFIKGKCLD